MDKRFIVSLTLITMTLFFSCGDLPQTQDAPYSQSPWLPGFPGDIPGGPGGGPGGGPDIRGLHRWTGAEGTWYQIFPMSFFNSNSGTERGFCIPLLHCNPYIPGQSMMHVAPCDPNNPCRVTDAWGDLRGIIMKLDYLSCHPNDCDLDLTQSDPNLRGECIRSLHVDGIWLTPVMPGTSYHKYDTECFISIDPRLGTMADMKELVREAHARGIRVIPDLVINHTSFRHPWFLNALEEWKNGELGHYSQFFVIRTHSNRYVNKEQAFGSSQWWRPDERHLEVARTPGGDYIFYWGIFGPWMPDLNWESPAVKREFERILEFWLSPQDQGGVGVDGFRLDATLHIFNRPGNWVGDTARNIPMLTWFAETARRFSPNVFLVGEAWTNADEIIEYHRPGKSSFAFDFADSGGRIRHAVMAGNGRTFTEGVLWYTREIERLHPQATFSPFITNHDKNRATAFLLNHEHRKMAASLLLLTPGTPFIYYGEEIGLLGTRPGGDHQDRVARGPMMFYANDPPNQPHPGVGRGGGNWRWSDFNNRHPVYGGPVEHQRHSEWSLLRHHIRIQNMKMRHPFIAWGRVDDAGIETDMRGQVVAFRVTDDKPYLLDWRGNPDPARPNPTYGRRVVIAHNVFGAGGEHGFLRIPGMVGMHFNEGMSRVVERASALYVPPSGTRPPDHRDPISFDPDTGAFWLRPYATVIIMEGNW